MNMFARFDESLAMTLQDIKETKRYERTHTRTDAQTDNVKTVYPPQTKFAGGIMIQQNTKMGKNLKKSYVSIPCPTPRGFDPMIIFPGVEANYEW